MARAPTDLRSLARSHTEMALRTLCGIAQSGESEIARVNASIHILDRGWGKAPQSITGADGEGAVRVTIRHILEAAAPREPLTIEATREQTTINKQE